MFLVQVNNLLKIANEWFYHLTTLLLRMPLNAVLSLRDLIQSRRKTLRIGSKPKLYSMVPPIYERPM